MYGFLQIEDHLPFTSLCNHFPLNYDYSTTVVGWLHPRKTNMAPENEGPLGKWNSYWKPKLFGSMIVVTSLWFAWGGWANIFPKCGLMVIFSHGRIRKKTPSTNTTIAWRYELANSPPFKRELHLKSIQLGTYPRMFTTSAKNKIITLHSIEILAGDGSGILFTWFLKLTPM